VYKLLIDEKAVKEISKLDKPIQRFIFDSLETFAENYERLRQSKKVKALSGNLKGFYRLRLRTFRVIYKEYPEKLVIYVLRVAHREDIYKN